MIRRC